VVKISNEWLGGFFDGEGCVSITNSHSRRTGKRQLKLYVRITQKNTSILQAIKARLGGTLRMNKGKSCGYLEYTCKKAERFLKVIAPFVIVKWEVVELALKYRSLVGPRSYRTPKKIKEQMLEIRKKIMELNAAD
jgi:hypothetical protein